MHARIRLWGLTRLASVLTAAVLLAGVAGCGVPTPAEALRDRDARVEMDERTRIDVRAAEFPPETTDDKLAIFSERAEEFQSLHTLDLSGTRITDAGLEHVAALKGLTELNLNDTGVGDEGMAHVGELTNLVRLNIGDTAVSDKGLEHLHDLKNLETLILTGDPRPKRPEPRNWLTALRFGIDLAGGTNLVYRVDRQAAEEEGKEVTGDVMDQMVAAVRRRLDPGGVEEITVRAVGSDRIEVIIPQVDPAVVARKKDMMTRLGSLEFALLANPRDHADIIKEARQLESTEKDWPIGDGRIASWRPVGRDSQGNPKDVGTGRAITREVVSREGEPVTEFLLIRSAPEERVTGKYLTRAYQTTDQGGGLAVGFTFNITGGQLFAELTSANRPREDESMRRLAVLLDGEVHSAPDILDTISTQGQITGRFTSEEIDELISVLNAGALVVPLERDPISEQTISPTLGLDVREKGKWAIIIAGIAVLCFMPFYYRFAGLVADMCLVMNIMLVMGTMAVIDAAFTLPGLAGIVLTIGMAVDANVLIFERMREELRRGSSLRMAIQNGFGKALSAIVDGSLTTLITAVVLYMIGTDQVRGFAVTLFIGIVMSMFSALYFGRLVFDVCERKRWLRKITMTSFVGTPSWDFISKKRIAAAASIVLISAGIAAVAVRGSDLLDIDFSGGTMATFEFVEPRATDEVRRALAGSEALGATLTIEEITVQGEEPGRRFRVRTKNTNEQQVTGEITAIMKERGMTLRQVTMDYGQIESIPAEQTTQAGSRPAGVPPPAREYRGGRRVELTFYDNRAGGGVQLSTAGDDFSRHLVKLQTAGGEPKYPQPDEMFELIGLQKDEETIQREAAGEGNVVPRYKTALLRAKPGLQEDDLRQTLASMKEYLAEHPLFSEINTFDAAVAADMQQSAILAILFSIAAIVAYIWFRFQRVTFGFAAVAALVHDVLVVLGVVALFGFLGTTAAGQWLDFKINLPMIAAFLTIVGYSLNDTIVIFDRIREIRGKNPALTEAMVNSSLNQTLARTILTSLTTLIVVSILYGWGGEGIRGFAFCLIVGVLTGTYSTIYIANPVLLWLMNRPGSPSARAAAAREAQTAGVR